MSLHVKGPSIMNTSHLNCMFQDYHSESDLKRSFAGTEGKIIFCDKIMINFFHDLELFNCLSVEAIF